MKNFYIAKSRRLRGTKYTSRVEKQGVTSYTVYNHMLLPASFGSIESLYHHLKEDVQVWDAAVQRQLEISGKDSSKLVQMMTCRDLSKAKEGRCYYCPIIDNKGGIINDPVVLKLSDEKWWISLSDSDVGLYAKGLAIGYNFEVEISEPDVDIFSVQGPKSFQLMEKVLGDYKGTVPITLITQKRPSIGSSSSEVVALKGVRYAVMQEPSKGDKIIEKTNLEETKILAIVDEVLSS